jgi:hypothetical protein
MSAAFLEFHAKSRRKERGAASSVLNGVLVFFKVFVIVLLRGERLEAMS